jgi:hypothetical protein
VQEELAECRYIPRVFLWRAADDPRFLIDSPCRKDRGYRRRCAAFLPSRACRQARWYRLFRWTDKHRDEHIYQDSESVGFPKLDDRQLALLDQAENRRT